VRWSVGIEAEGEKILGREEVVELADAIAASHGIATGIGTSRYGAQLVVEADSREDAVSKAIERFLAAAAAAGLPPAPVVRTEAVSEAEEVGGRSWRGTRGAEPPAGRSLGGTRGAEPPVGEDELR
jgi:hypothetical protein